MLQLRTLNHRVLGDLRATGQISQGPVAGADLEAEVDAAIARLRRERRLRAHGPERLAARLDNFVRTDLPEQFDDPHLPAEHRRALAQGLHRHNRLVGAYWRFLRILAPFIRETSARTGRPVRCLELACGSGELAIALDGEARRRGFRVDVVGSDLAASSVADARRRAGGGPVRFEVIDALALDGLPNGAFDVIFIAQSAHHFTPGKLARMAAAGSRAATTAFVAIDGFRTLWMFPLLGATNAVVEPRMYHDSFITARKFYSEPELRLIGELAAGAERVNVRSSWPGWSVLEVRAAPQAS
jgi:SAM-dependent methyltransferase